MRLASIPALVLLSLLIPAGALRADEIRLKDGTKIEGTIVGFENDSFRVETAYGFALIRKDKVADINIMAAKPESKPESKLESKKDTEIKPESRPESKLESKKDSEPKAKSSVPVPPPSSTAPTVVPAVARE